MFASILVLAVSMTAAVRRSAEGRQLAAAIADQSREEQVLRAQIADEIVRVDSLAQRDRILRVAASLGLRPAREVEVHHLSEPLLPSAGPGDGTP